MTATSKNAAKSSKSAKAATFIAVAHRQIPGSESFRTVYVRSLANGEVSYTPTRTMAEVFTSEKTANRMLDAAAAARGLVPFGIQTIT